jgi:hypothetical protein
MQSQARPHLRNNLSLPELQLACLQRAFKFQMR